MLNKELLLMGGGAEEFPGIPEDWYTHVITVGKESPDSDQYGYHYDHGFGSLTPSIVSPVDNTPINSLVCASEVYTVELLTNGHFLADAPYLILARADRKQSLDTPNYAEEEGGSATWEDLEQTIPFFTEEDVGKRIPIWLSTSPPPWEDASW